MDEDVDELASDDNVQSQEVDELESTDAEGYRPERGENKENSDDEEEDEGLV